MPPSLNLGEYGLGFLMLYTYQLLIQFADFYAVFTDGTKTKMIVCICVCCQVSHLDLGSINVV